MSTLCRLLRGVLAAACALLLARSAAAQADAAPTEAPDAGSAEPSDADAVGFGETAAPPAAAQAAAPDSALAPSTGDVEASDPGFADATLSPAADGGNAAAPTPQPDAASPFTLSGGLRVQSAARMQGPSERRLGKLRQVLLVKLEYASTRGSLDVRGVASLRAESDFAYLLNRDQYDAPTLDVYAAQLLPGETYLALRGAWLGVAAGEQVVNLGQGEVLSVLDLVNPRDLREPLSADLEELRLPVLLTRLNLNKDRTRLQLIAVHEAYFGLLPPPLGEFSPFRKLLLGSAALSAALGSRELRNQHFPQRNLELDATQFHGKLSWSGDGVDVALQVSSVLDALGVPSLPSASAFAQQRLDLPLYHPRYLVLGHSGAWQLGSFVLRWELAAQLARPIPLQRTDTALPIWTNERLDLLSALLGVTYAFDASTSAALELQPSYLVDHPARRAGSHLTTLFPIEAPQLALRINHQFLRDRATLALLGYLIGLAPVNAAAVRAELGYALLDAVRITVGMISYYPTRHFGPLYGFERNDRLFCNFSWDFS